MRRVALWLGGISFAFGAAPFCAAAFASDLLILASGDRRSGALTSCDDERCQFEGAPVPLDGLLWIGLAVGEGEAAALAPPRGIAAPGAVLADGSTNPGKLVGLSKGSIVLDTGELERGTVRWLRIAAIPPAVDILIRRDGALRTGTVQGCTAGGCTMAGVTATRAELAWVGLGASPETIVIPQLPEDPTRDQAELADGSTRATALIGVNAADVVLGVGTLPRSQVAWIYLAPPAREGGPPVIRDPPAQAPPPTRPPTPPPAPSPAPPGPPGVDPPPAQGGLGETGALWIGTLQERDVVRAFPGSYRTSLFSLRLRETSISPMWFQLSGN